MRMMAYICTSIPLQMEPGTVNVSVIDLDHNVPNEAICKSCVKGKELHIRINEMENEVQSCLQVYGVYPLFQ
jgi:hypothetical protein